MLTTLHLIPKYTRASLSRSAREELAERWRRDGEELDRVADLLSRGGDSLLAVRLHRAAGSLRAAADVVA